MGIVLHGPKRLIPDVAPVFVKEGQEPLVVSRWHVETAHQHLVAAAGMLESQSNQRADLMPVEIARHIARVNVSARTMPGD